jgi:AcrR family transcriptional regulator
MIPSRKELEKSQRRHLLLEAASRVFGRKPFDEASMQEVAAEAQIGMQGLYEQFPSKQALYEQVILARALAFQAKAERILSAGGAPLEMLRGLALAYADQFRERPMHLPMFIRDRVQFDWGFDSRFMPRLREVYEAERSRLKALLSQAIAAGQLLDLDADFLTQLCFGVLEASLYHSHRNRSEEPADACVGRAMGCFLRAAGAQP